MTSRNRITRRKSGSRPAARGQAAPVSTATAQHRGSQDRLKTIASAIAEAGSAVIPHPH
jgi:hypothetical protein